MNGLFNSSARGQEPQVENCSSRDTCVPPSGCETIEIMDSKKLEFLRNLVVGDILWLLGSQNRDCLLGKNEQFAK